MLNNKPCYFHSVSNSGGCYAWFTNCLATIARGFILSVALPLIRFRMITSISVPKFMPVPRPKSFL